MILRGCYGEAWTPHVANEDMYAGTRFSLVFSYVGSSGSLGSHLLGRGHLIHTPGFSLFVPGTLSRTSPFISWPLQRMVVSGIKHSHTSMLCSPNSMGFSFMPLNIYPVPSTQPSRYTVNSHLGINNSETLWQVFFIRITWNAFLWLSPQWLVKPPC